MKLRRWSTIALVVVAGVTLGAPAARAAVPDRAGFVLFAAGAVSNAFPAGTAVGPSGVPGHWVVRFPGQAAPNGIVHVTAVHDGVGIPPGRWCQAEDWGPVGADEQVKVACYAPGGAADPRPGFSVLFTRSSGPFAGPDRYGYVDANPAGVIISQYNSVGAVSTITHAGPGLYSFSLNGLGTASPNAGHLQLTAVNPAAGARCKVATWSSSPNGQFGRILCHNAVGAPADTRFALSYQFQRSLYGPKLPPSRYGYLWQAPPLGPAPTNFNSTGVANTLAGGGPYGLRYPNLASNPGNAQVTAVGGGADFCNLQAPWSIAGPDMVLRVACYTSAGASVPGAFFAGYSARA